MTISRIKIAALLSISIIILNKAMAIETPKHTLVKKENGFEIRQYDSMIIATTSVRVIIQMLHLPVSGESRAIYLVATLPA